MSTNRIRRFLAVICLLGGVFSFAAAGRGQAVGQSAADESGADDGESVLVAFQPPVDEQLAVTPPAAQSPSVPRFTRTRLARAPSMFGDFFSPPVQLAFGGRGTPVMNDFAIGRVDLPIGGGALQRTKISENNKALPVDRVYAVYNHFENAITTQFQPMPFAPPVAVSQSVDRYLVGFEKTFFDEAMSVELRVPFATGADLGFFDPLGQGFSAPANEFGNLNLVFKVLAHESDNFAAAVGLGVDLPTAADANVLIVQAPQPFPPLNLQIQNEAVYLQPFVAIAATPTENSFVNAFVEVDLQTGGNSVLVKPDPAAPTMQLGRLNNATLLEADVAFGRWFYQSPRASFIQGLAGVVELHYITMLNDPDQLVGDLGGSALVLGNQFNRQDFLDLTAGLHAALGENTTLRVAAVVPLRGLPDRTFDAEVMVQLNHFLR